MWKPSRRLILYLVAAAVLLLAVGLVLRARSGRESYVTAVVDRGTIVEGVGATGTLQAVTTVQVGSQVSGIIQSLYADFNSIVRMGQVVARLDPSLFEARVGQARANLVAARANTERSQTQVEDTRQKYERAKELFEQNLLPETDLETAKANRDSATAQLKASVAAVTQAEASLNQAEVDLQHTVITAPISGVVIARNIDVGQTVAASFQAPTLFVIANDLSRMQVNASVDEADIGRVRAGQEATFRVDAYAERTFTGRVEQVRLQPVTVQNVVTYNTIISAENRRQLLMPGMTATVTIVVNRCDDVLRLPAAALRFRPEGAVSERRVAVAGASPSVGSARASRGSASGEPTRSGRRRDRENVEAGSGGSRPSSEEGGEKARGRRGEVYVLEKSGQPVSRSVILGVSDGQYVEVRQGLAEGESVVTGLEGIAGGAARASGQTTTANPFAPQRPQRRQR